jgi:hypothetical protein
MARVALGLAPPLASLMVDEMGHMLVCLGEEGGRELE